MRDSLAKDYKWVKCGTCGADIERAKKWANKVFTCYDCKRERSKNYERARKIMKNT